MKEVLNFFVKLIYISCLFTIADSFCVTSRTDGTEIGTEIGTETGTEGTEIVEVQETIDLAGKRLKAEAVCITDPILEILGEFYVKSISLIFDKNFVKAMFTLKK